VTINREGVRLNDRAAVAAPAAQPTGQRGFWISLARYWLLVFNLVMGLYVVLPWLAPMLMQWGYVGPARIIYLFYSTQCHQLPQRSFFLFGESVSYSLGEIQRVWQATDNPLILRQFIGSAEMGWKVAWSDRMVAMYTPIWLAGLAFPLLRRHMRPLTLWQFVALIVPLAIDGGTHLMSDLGGLGQGFRDTNAWLAFLTGDVFPAWFYAGDALGSFNSWMRLLSGLLFGLAVVGLGLPYLTQWTADTRERSAA
jgi:uncharacterized membrane protein